MLISDSLNLRILERLKVEKWGKVTMQNLSQNTAEVAIFIADKIDFKTIRLSWEKGIFHTDEFNLQRCNSSICDK